MPGSSNAAREIFAHRLKAIRVPRGFKTARSLAKALGIDENRYTRYERGEVEPDLALLSRICETLRVTPNDLLVSRPIHAPGLERPGVAEGENSYWLEEHVLAPTVPSPAEAGAPAGQLRSWKESERTTAGEMASGSDPMTIKRRALAWQLASLVVSLSTNGTSQRAETPDRPVGSLKQTSQLYAEIEADPFAFAARLADLPNLDHASPGDQARMANLVNDLIAAVREAVND